MHDGSLSSVNVSAVRRILIVFLTSGCFLAVGCTPEPVARQMAPAVHEDHAHDSDHKHPETLAEGVTELESLCKAVQEAFAAGDQKKADPSVHEIGHLIEDLEGLFTAAKLAPAEMASAQKAREELFECFDQIDTRIHQPEDEKDPKGETYDAMAERIAAAIKVLQGVSQGVSQDVSQGASP